MSFSSQVKTELARLVPERACCTAAMTYGLLECGRAFSAAEVSLKTESAAIANLYQTLVTQTCGLEVDACADTLLSSGTHKVTVDCPADRVHVLERFGHSPVDVFLRLNRSNLDCDSCPAAFLRGAFLSCGTVSDPRADYHLEFSIPYHRLSRDLWALMLEMELGVRLARRKGYNVLYLKDSGQIEDCLTLMGAVGAALEIMNIKILKDVRNTANRVTNCENANIDKTVAAALTQSAAINRLAVSGGLDSLPDELREVAMLRLENPEMSLRELGEQLSPPLTRSGVNHRLQKIMELAGKLL